MADGPKPDQFWGERDWRRDLQSLYELELREIASVGALITRAVGCVVIIGLDNLDCAGPPLHSPQIASLNQNADGFVHQGTAISAQTEAQADLPNRWRDAIYLELGADEAQRFLLAWAERVHSRPTK
jgi:hypothetical protein